jgi:hypothetical protein
VTEPKNEDPPRPSEDVPAPKPPEAPKADTSTDWDEWIEKHGGRPPAVPDVADEQGRFRTAPRP